MKINIRNFEIALARACMNSVSLREAVSSETIRRVRKGQEVKPATAGRIARALGVDITELTEEEEICQDTRR